MICREPPGGAGRCPSPAGRGRRLGAWLRWVVVHALSVLLATSVLAADPERPLKPVDRSSPAAALRGFLDGGDALGEFLVREYLPAPSHAAFARLLELGDVPLHSLDLSEVPSGGRQKAGRAAAIALYETLSRIPLPPPETIPASSDLKPASGQLRWIIPDTEIALVRVEGGPGSGDFLFSPETVARAAEFYERVRHLPYARPVPLKGFQELVSVGGGWMVPYSWVQSLPPALRGPLASQAAWKWVGLALLALVLVIFLLLAYRLSRLCDRESRLLRALAHFAMPTSVLAATPAATYLALVQLNFTGSVGTAIELGSTVLMFVVGAWMAWRLAPVVAEGVVASVSIDAESTEAHVIRVGARLVGLIAAVVLLAMGADRLGVPVYGIVAGLGVGGLTIALAARASVENLIGGMSLFADKPVRVGEFCRYGDAQGTVEAIGIRSSRIRGVDRTLTTIPNAVMARLPIVNHSRRDSMLLKTVIGLRYETTADRLRYVLVRLRELLLGHPRVKTDSARVRFVGFAASSLDVELFAYLTTTSSAEFLAIQEDILLRVIDIVEQSGVALAFPSQTLYLGRDQLPDDERSKAAEAAVREWRAQGKLPFPDFPPEEVGSYRGTLAYPPPGSSQAASLHGPLAGQTGA